MYLVLLWTATMMLVLTNAEEINKKCFKLIPPVVLGCCKSGFMPTTRSANTNMEDKCNKIPKDSCARDACIGKQLGYVKDDGNIDSEAFEILLLQIIKNAPPLIAALKKNCINSDLRRFGPPGVCEVLKFYKCVQKQVLNDCKEWRDSGPCAGIKDLVKECAN